MNKRNYLIIQIFCLLIGMLEIIPGCKNRVTTGNPSITRTASNNTATGVVSDTNQPMVSSPAIMSYEYYELKRDNLKSVLGTFKPPIFSFEYPALVETLPFNHSGSNLYDSFHVAFSFHQEGLPESEISIIVTNHAFPDPDRGIGDPIDPFAPPPVETPIMISGIRGDYFEDYRHLSNPGYRRYDVSLKAVKFDYSGLNWIIYIDWYYRDNEPPEVKEYFNDMITTFKLIDQPPSKTAPGD
jgi:hypothetical protein